MKITKLQLEKIIQEEIENVLEERIPLDDGSEEMRWADALPLPLDDGSEEMRFAAAEEKNRQRGIAKARTRDQKTAAGQRMKDRAKIKSADPSYGFVQDDVPDPYARYVSTGTGANKKFKATLPYGSSKAATTSDYSQGRVKAAKDRVRAQRDQANREDAAFDQAQDDYEFLQENAINEETRAERIRRKFREKQGRAAADAIFAYAYGLDHNVPGKDKSARLPQVATKKDLVDQLSKLGGQSAIEFLIPDDQFNADLKAASRKKQSPEQRARAADQTKTMKRAFMKRYMDLQLANQEREPVRTNIKFSGAKIDLPNIGLDVSDTGRTKYYDKSRAGNEKRAKAVWDPEEPAKTPTPAETPVAQKSKSSSKSRGPKPKLRSDWKTLSVDHPDRVAYRQALRNWKKGKPSDGLSPIRTAAQRKAARKKFLATASPEAIAKDNEARLALGLPLDKGTQSKIADIGKDVDKLSKSTAIAQSNLGGLEGNFAVNQPDTSWPDNLATMRKPAGTKKTAKAKLPDIPGSRTSGSGMLSRGMKLNLGNIQEERSYIKKLIEEVYDEVLAEGGWYEPHV